MSSPTQTIHPNEMRRARHRLHLPTVPEALASLLQTIVVALFLLTFVLQPFLIPSESMEHTLLVGDFLLVNKQIFAPAARRAGLTRWLMPYRDVERGDVVAILYPEDTRQTFVKRVIGLPGDRIRMVGKQVIAKFLDDVSSQLPGARMEKFEMKCFDVERIGDSATEWCEEHQHVVFPSGKPPFDGRGKMLLVLHRGADGKWRMRREMWNEGITDSPKEQR